MASVMLPRERDEAGFVAGSELNFDLVFRNYGAALRSFCQARLGNAADADDACQEAMLKAYRARAGFRKGAAIWPWLATIAANVCIDMQRTSGRTTTMDELGDHTAPGPEAAVDQRLRAEIVETAVRTLPDRYRAHVYWRDYEGWSYEEMARVEGTSIASVRTTLMRARRALRERVESVASARRAWPLPAFLPLFTKLRGAVAHGRATVRGAWERARYAPPDQLPAFGNAVAAAVLTVGIVATGSAAAGPAPTTSAAMPHIIAVSTAPVTAAPAPATAPAPAAAPRAHGPAPVQPPVPATTPATGGYRAAPLSVAPPTAPPNSGIQVGPVGFGCPSIPRSQVGQVICQNLSNP